MKLDFIPLDKLSVSRTNMRYGRKDPDVSDILPTVRKRGVIQTLIVRPNGEEGAFEIVAGWRRFVAASIVAAETGEDDPQATMLPCAILEPGDDAAALEISMIENMARLDADEVTQWESFTRLVKQGQGVDDIAATFGLPELTVKRVLALGNLLPRIRDLYRKEKIDTATVRHLTLASKSQQKAWLVLMDDPQAWCPTGHQLKGWLFGGQSIPVKHALFEVATYTGQIVTDLFGEGGYFADAEAFWTAQNAAIDNRRAAFIDEGWSDVVIVPPSEQFATWEHERAQKRKGGRVYVDVRANGEVIFHEGYVTRKEARAGAKVEGPGTGEKATRPEISSMMQTYIDLHRHAAVRADLLAHPGVALRLMVAHAIAGSHLWRATPDPRTPRSECIAESVENSSAEGVFDTGRRAVLGLLGFDAQAPTVCGSAIDGVTGVFLRLLDLPDPAVMDVFAVVMGETLASGSAAVEALGLHLGTDMTAHWQADDAFFELIRDKEVLGRIVAEVAGDTVAAANAGEKTKVLKSVIRDCLDGTNGRARVERWVPRWIAFPPSAYTERGGVGTVKALAKVEHLREQQDDPDPDAPGAVLALPAPEPEAETMPLAA
ncbi:MAG: chromosome partitioning protein ParB [Sphingomonas bacterium]|uniref:ParB/RepB/Spo0J family partition protein n=1 Tax=Sphingomonas bacterium TaxID=1895847 RepID=UPI0026252B88|nr:ParB N-terminal domain-containing protein [Sphingomonas bacterium]MDB5707215.1 chromosome partitioning protein ParB [Sphingomonas bacterium]